MSLIPEGPRGLDPDRDHPAFLDRRRSVDEVRRAWAVRAAQWQAVALAEEIFDGPVTFSTLGLRASGPMRGLIELRVPFDDLESHVEREARFLASAARDPVLSQVPLVYVLGPDAG
ncbi:MAG: hypothetical protein RH859_12080 [Longimicrobiales bacterium]